MTWIIDSLTIGHLWTILTPDLFGLQMVTVWHFFELANLNLGFDWIVFVLFSVCAGALEYYDKTYDRVNVKNEKPLKRVDRVFHTVTTTDDPIIRKLTRSQPEVNVFATDAILATLMCCTRSVYSWDIVVQKIGGKIFLDKRDNTEFGRHCCFTFYILNKYENFTLLLCKMFHR